MNDLLQSGLHPNADTLSAFAENALPAHERTQTLAHLSSCAACREIVFLAQQAAPQPAAAPEPFWQRWRNSAPLFGLGIGAAALACAGLLFMTLRTHPTAAPTESAHVQPLAPPQLTPATPTVSPQPATPKPTPPPSALKGTGFSPYAMPDNKVNGALAPEGAVVGAPRPPAKPMPPTVLMSPQPIIAGRAFVGSSSAAAMGAGVGAPRASAVNLGSAAPASAAPMPAAPPSAAETVTVESAAALGTETARGNTALADEARVTDTLATEKKSRQRSVAPSSQIAALAAPARAPLPTNLATTVTVSNGTRTLAADTAGALFLSLDSGRHWQPVTPQWNGRVAQLRLAPARNTPTAPPPPLTLDATSSDDSKPAAAAPKLPPAPLEFQLVTAAGTVWISTDGLHWQPK
jgi:hypothetical protein